MFCIGKLVEYYGTIGKKYCGRISDIIPKIDKDVKFRLNDTSVNSDLRKNSRNVKLKSYVAFNLKNYEGNSSVLIPELVSLLDEIRHEALYRHIKTNKLEGKDIDWIIQKYCLEDERKDNTQGRKSKSLGDVLANGKVPQIEENTQRFSSLRQKTDEIYAREETEAKYPCQNKSVDDRQNDSSDNSIQSYIDYLRARGVRSFVHFTPAENLGSIMENGLRPRTVQILQGKTTDNLRLDAKPEALSLSISFPNYMMFFMKRNEMTQTDFVVLQISIDSLKEFSVNQIGFYANNAASAAEITKTFDAHCNFDSLKNMFAATEKRKESLPKEYTTNPQAEIMIKGIVPVKYIEEIVFEKQSVLEKYWCKCGCPYRVDSSLFRWRCDYAVWQKQKNSESQNAGNQNISLEEELPW